MEKTTPPNPTIGRVQPSIRSFFQPRQQPTYAPPPSSTTTACPTLTKQPPNPTISPSDSPLTSAPSVSKLPQGASIKTVEESHIQPLRRINSLLLPIAYPDAFYHRIIQPSSPSPQNFSRTILWTHSPTETKVIGGLVCRLDLALADNSTPQAPKHVEGLYDIYIQSLVLLSPYRGKGLATSVLEDVVQAAVEEVEVRIRGLYAHVWTENTEALKWYAARGFKREESIMSGYYRKLKPDTAWILRRRLNPSDHLHDHPLHNQSENSLPSTAISSKSESTPLPSTAASRPLPVHQARSFQDRGPDREWNDLPEDVLGNGLLNPMSRIGTPADGGSVASSRSSSRSGADGKGGKKKRVYPAAAFGS